ncbi:MAG: hypothetical protein ABI168_04055, partial [Ginsengibacter sp.]
MCSPKFIFWGIYQWLSTEDLIYSFQNEANRCSFYVKKYYINFLCRGRRVDNFSTTQTSGHAP